MAEPLLYLPSAGFKRVESQKDQVAIHRTSGEIIQWPWAFDPSNFLWTVDLTPFYNDLNPTTYLERTRQGLDASDLFKDDPKVCIQGNKNTRISIGSRKKGVHGISTFSQGRLRKKKYKKVKYKNSKNRRNKRLDKKRKKKIYRKDFSKTEINSIKEKCIFCQISSECDNIFNDPRDRHSCDCCEKCFNGIQLYGNICSYCLNAVYRKNFCADCKHNLGEWNINWRLDFGLSHTLHPPRCNCRDCLENPCIDCGMTSHVTRECPWRPRSPSTAPPINIEETWIPGAQEPYYDDDDDQRAFTDFILGLEN